MTTSSEFGGVGPQTITFLRDLHNNNSKAWFDAHRKDYDAHWMGTARRLVTGLGDALQGMDPTIHALPKVNGSIFRINRDTRFSKDKTPYKDHMDLWFWGGAERKNSTSGFFFRLRHDSVLLGAGNHMFAKDKLSRFREAVDDEKRGASLTRTVVALRSAGYDVGGEHYKRVPKPYDGDHPRADLLRHNALHAGTEEPLPEELGSPEFIDWCMERMAPLHGLHSWLMGALE